MAINELTKQMVMAERTRIEQTVTQNEKLIAEAQSLVAKLTADNVAMKAQVDASVTDVPRPIAKPIGD